MVERKGSYFREINCTPRFTYILDMLDMYKWQRVHDEIQRQSRGNPLLSKLSHLNCHPLEVVPRYRDPQLQVVGDYPYLFNLGPSI